MKDIERLRHRSPREFWKHFSKKQYVNNNISVEEFNDYFSQLFNEMPNVYNDKAKIFCNEHDFNVDDFIFEELEKPITVKEIECVINKLKTNKAFGGDSRINEYFIATVEF